MSLFIRLSVIVAAMVAFQACASHPGPAVPAIPAGAAATPAANQAPAPGQIHTLLLEDKTLSQDEVNRLLSQGYKPQKGRGDAVLYCREEPQMGTHFEKKVCLTADQIKTATVEGREITEKLQQNGGNPQR
jgi:hypothetical protein